MPPTRRGPSIRDVAAHAGVSHQTVSRVLNNPTSVKESTRLKVQEAIEALGFRRNRAARSLATSSSMVIGLITVQSSLFGPTQMDIAIADECRRRGYTTVNLKLAADDEETLSTTRDYLLSLGVDGAIVNAWSQKVLNFAYDLAKHVPMCAVAEGQVPEQFSRVRPNNFESAKGATEYLRSIGCQRISHLAGPKDWLEAEARHQGWLAGGGNGAVVEAGWSPEGGFEAVAELISRMPDTDGIVAANDHVAVGAMRRLEERGKKVPQDIAIFGFDDIELASFVSVPLASIRQPFAQMGTVAVELLFNTLNGDKPQQRTIPTDFVLRESARR